MEEKVLHEVRIIETEDGFRIEIKGDKERIRRMGFARAIGFGMGRPKGRRGGRRRHGMRHGKGRHGHPRHGGRWDRGRGWWEEESSEATGEPADAPAGV